jgi:hypothetical protein
MGAYPYYLPYAVNVLCLLHAFRTGRDQRWIWLLLMVPVVGAIIYVVVEVLPGLRGGGVDLSRLPWFEKRRIRALEEALVESDTADKRSDLAGLYLKYGRTADALTILEPALAGPLRNHHELIHTLARLQAENGVWDEAEATLARLDQAGSGIHKRSRRLLLARIRAGQGRAAEAEEMFRDLARSEDSEEPRYRYAAFLRAAGRHDEADEVMRRIAKHLRGAESIYRRTERYWLARAKADQAAAAKERKAALAKAA